MKITQTILEKFLPLNELSPENLNKIAGKSKIVDKPIGTEIEGVSRGHWLNYLLSGTIQFIENHETHLLKENTNRSRHPIFPLSGNNQKSRIRCKTPCKILQVDKELFEVLIRDQRTSGCEINNVDLSDTETEILFHLYTAIKNGQLDIPSMPETALRLRDATLRPDITVSEIAQIIRLDPSIAMALITHANSAAQRTNQNLDSLEDCILRLGFDQTRLIATRIAMHRVFKSTNHELKKQMHKVWQHSIQISALSAGLAEVTATETNTETVQLAGLLHDIGAIPILDYAQAQNLLIQGLTPDRVVNHLKIPVGLLILDYWQLNSPLAEVVEYSEDWQHDSHSQQGNLADYVIVAHRLLLPTEAAAPPLESLTAWKKLGGNPDNSKQLCQDAMKSGQRHIQEFKRLLSVSHTHQASTTT